MPADYLSRNAIDVIGIFSDQWKLAQEEQDEFCTLYTHTNNCSCKHLEIADSCFTDAGIFWIRIFRLDKRKTVIIVPKTLRQKIISGRNALGKKFVLCITDAFSK